MEGSEVTRLLGVTEGVRGHQGARGSWRGQRSPECEGSPEGCKVRGHSGAKDQGSPGIFEGSEVTGGRGWGGMGTDGVNEGEGVRGGPWASPTHL